MGNDSDAGIFITSTDAEFAKNKVIKTAIIVFTVFSSIASLGLLVGIALLSFIEMLFLFSLVYYVKQRESRNGWKLKFEQDTLTIYNLLTYESFVVYDIPSSDFIITQSKKEKELDYCDMITKNTVFTFV